MRRSFLLVSVFYQFLYFQLRLQVRAADQQKRGNEPASALATDEGEDFRNNPYARWALEHAEKGATCEADTESNKEIPFRSCAMKIASMLLMAAMASCLTLPALAQSAGETVYKQKCAMCHGADGEGNTPAGKMMKVQSFKSPAMIKEPDAELIAATKKGKGKMPEFGSKLSDTQIKAVIAYMRQLQKK